MPHTTFHTANIHVLTDADLDNHGLFFILLSLHSESASSNKTGKIGLVAFEALRSSDRVPVMNYVTTEADELAHLVHTCTINCYANMYLGNKLTPQHFRRPASQFPRLHYRNLFFICSLGNRNPER